MTYDNENPDYVLGQAQQCGGVTPFNGIPLFPFEIIRCPTAIQIKTQ